MNSWLFRANGRLSGTWRTQMSVLSQTVNRPSAVMLNISTPRVQLGSFFYLIQLNPFVYSTLNYCPMTSSNFVALPLIKTLSAAMSTSCAFIVCARDVLLLSYEQNDDNVFECWGLPKAHRALWRDWGTDRTHSLWHIQSLRSNRNDLTTDENHDINGVVLIKRNCFRVQSSY